MEQKNVKIFYKPVDGGELKELECVAESDGFEFEPLENHIDVEYDPTPVTNSFSFDVPVDKMNIHPQTTLHKSSEKEKEVAKETSCYN